MIEEKDFPPWLKINNYFLERKKFSSNRGFLEKMRKAKKLRGQGKSYREISKEVGVDPKTVMAWLERY